jgi:hypothetical protein
MDGNTKLLGCQLMGGLGNQLFQIAAAYSLAKRNGYKLVFSETIQHAPDRLPVWDNYLTPNPNTKARRWDIIPNKEYYNILWTVLPEPKWSYTPFPAIKDTKPYILIGYFQSSQYFDDKEEIRRMFKPSYSLLLKSHSYLQENGVIIPEEWIGAHVRRGDYVTVKDSNLFLVCGVDYYKRARARVSAHKTGRRPVCWITDDIEWVKGNLLDASEGDIVLSNENPYIDFTALTQFKDMILSNSSFSWWASWLNPNQYEGRTICCPNKWFGPAGPAEYESVYEADWVRIETTPGNVVAQDSNQVMGSKAGH